MNNPILLTQRAYDRLGDELAELLTVARPAIARRIQEAREEGDLKENGGYHAAKEEQGKIEARINRLEEMLANAEIGSSSAQDGVVKQGLMVTCAINGNETEFFLGSHEIFEGTPVEAKIDAGDFNVYSPDSPIGRQIIGERVGSEVSYLTPIGKSVSVKIIKLEEYPH